MGAIGEERFLRWIAEHDPRYHANAYQFTLEALRYTQQFFHVPKHVSGQQLLVGISKHARDKFGDLAWTVFQEWGIHSSRDFGNIVFNLVEVGEIKALPDDSIDDFDTGFDLEKELQKVEI